MAAKPLTYKEAGVDIDTANTFIQKIKPLVKKTERPEVLSSIGHYGGLFALNKDKYREPILVSSTDGVGTKLKLALDAGIVGGLGQDLVAMSANDLLCLGAEPLFFLDYFATGKLEVARATEIVKGIAEACSSMNCSLLGGETAEMPKIYRDGDFDLAGFMVGIIEKSEIIDGSKIKAGDKLIGLASSGFHSNGYSLVRKVISKKKLSLKKKYPPLKKPLGEALLTPTRLYVNPVLKLTKLVSVRGIAHITGGGLLENLPRIFPADCRAVIRRSSWKFPSVFSMIQKWGNIDDHEMYRVFNCGVGLVVVVPAEEADAAVKHLKELGEEAWILGEILGRRKGDDVIEIL